MSAGLTFEDIIPVPGGLVLNQICTKNGLAEKFVMVNTFANSLTPEPFGFIKAPQAFVVLLKFKVSVCPAKYLPWRDLDRGLGMLITSRGLLGRSIDSMKFDITHTPILIVYSILLRLGSLGAGDYVPESLLI